MESPEPHCEEERRSNGEDLERMARRRGFASRNAQNIYTFTTTSPASLKWVFFTFLILQLTTLYSGHIASESLLPSVGTLLRFACDLSTDCLL